MALQKITFTPGINREGTAYDNELGWFDCNLVRFRKNAVEKDISDVSDADLAELVTTLQSQITGLQASQQAFVKISDLNLFQFIR